MENHPHLSTEVLQKLAEKGRVVAYLGKKRTDDAANKAEKAFKAIFGTGYQIHTLKQSFKNAISQPNCAVLITDDWRATKLRAVPPTCMCFHFRVLEALQNGGKIQWNHHSLLSTLLTNEAVFFHGFPCKDTVVQGMERKTLKEHNCCFVSEPEQANIVYVSDSRSPITMETPLDGMPDPKKLINAYLGGAAIKTRTWLEGLKSETLDGLEETRDTKLRLDGLAFFLSRKSSATKTLISLITKQGGDVVDQYHKFCQLVMPEESESEDEEFFSPSVTTRFKENDRPCISSSFLFDTCTSPVPVKTRVFTEPPKLRPFYLCNSKNLKGRRVFVQEDVTRKENVKDFVQKCLEKFGVTILDTQLREDTVFCRTLSVDIVQPHYHSMALLREWILTGPVEKPLSPWHLPVHVPAKLYGLFKDKTFDVFGNAYENPEIEFEIDILKCMGARNAGAISGDVPKAQLQNMLIIWDGIANTPLPLFENMQTMKVLLGNVFQIGFARAVVRELSPTKGINHALLNVVKSKFRIADIKRRIVSLKQGKTLSPPAFPVQEEIVPNQVDTPSTFYDILGVSSVDNDSTSSESSRSQCHSPRRPPLFDGTDCFILGTIRRGGGRVGAAAKSTASRRGRRGTKTKRSSTQARDNVCPPKRPPTLPSPFSTTEQQAATSSDSDGPQIFSQTHSLSLPVHCPQNQRVGTKEAPPSQRKKSAPNSRKRTAREKTQRASEPPSSSSKQQVIADKGQPQFEEPVEAAVDPQTQELPLLSVGEYKSKHFENGIFLERRLETLFLQLSGVLMAPLVSVWSYQTLDTATQINELISAKSVLPANGRHLYKCKFFGKDQESFSNLLCRTVQHFIHFLTLLSFKPVIAQLEDQSLFIIKCGTHNAICATISKDRSTLNAELCVNRNLLESYRNVPTLPSDLMPFQLGIQCNEQYNNISGRAGCVCSTLDFTNWNCTEQLYPNPSTSCYSECALALSCTGTNIQSIPLFLCYGDLGMRKLEAHRGKALNIPEYLLWRDTLLEANIPHQQFVCEHCFSIDFLGQSATKIGLVGDFGESVVCIGTNCRNTTKIFYMITGEELVV